MSDLTEGLRERADNLAEGGPWCVYTGGDADRDRAAALRIEELEAKLAQIEPPLPPEPESGMVVLVGGLVVRGLVRSNNRSWGEFTSWAKLVDYARRHDWEIRHIGDVILGGDDE